MWYSLAALYGSCWVAQCAARGAIRRKYDIPGNAFVDCLVSCCCCCCAVIQEYNQLHADADTPSAPRGPAAVVTARNEPPNVSTMGRPHR